jgi:LacI family transcriptional regulator
VLNNNSNVAPGTRRKVLAALQELAPPRQQHVLLGMILPDTNNPFFTALAFELDKECERRGASLMIGSSDGRAERELSLIERFTDIKVQGILFVSSDTGQSGTLVQAVSRNDVPPVVAFDRGVGNLDRVTVDSKKGTEQAVDYLVSFGHTKIGYLCGLAGTDTAAERFDSFQIAMAKNRLEVNPRWVKPGDFQVESGRLFADQLVAMEADEQPTAVLAANDLMALGLMQRLSEAGWVFPRDLSVIGFDDIPECNWVHPRLTTISQPIRRLVREALHLLLRRIDERSSGTAQPSPPKLIRIEPELVPRNSVDEPPSTKLHLVTELNLDR